LEQRDAPATEVGAAATANATTSGYMRNFCVPRHQTMAV